MASIQKAETDSAKTQCPLYPQIGMSLNHQRYQCHFFHVLGSSLNELRSFLAFIGYEADDSTVTRVFAATGGNVDSVLRPISSDNLNPLSEELLAFKACLEVDDLKSWMLKALAECVERTQKDGVQDYLRQVSLYELHQELDKMSITAKRKPTSLTESYLYCCADQDMINITEYTSVLAIGFRLRVQAWPSNYVDRDRQRKESRISSIANNIGHMQQYFTRGLKVLRAPLTDTTATTTTTTTSCSTSSCSV